MKEIGAMIPEISNEATREMAVFAIAELAKSTPIDVGTARSNWTATIGTTSITTRKAFAPYPSRHRPPYGPGGSMGEGRNQAGAVWSAAAAIKGKQPEQAVYIDNNLPYIQRLNQGHSKMAPAGFIERALERARQRGMDHARKLFRERFK